MKIHFSFRSNGLVLALAAVGVAAVLVGVGALNARADDNSQTCDELKQSAKNQLEKDNAMQAALYRRYAHILDGLMRTMNARLILNGRSISALAKITDDFAGELANFSGTHANYEQAVDGFLTAKCDTATETAREIGSLRENMIFSKERLDGGLQVYRDGIVAESGQDLWQQ
ncbi:MAG: hypothetical protein LBM12_02715 [Candidatus Nomurabacteria bacterium]|jgi:hypothetical protein|nr:hypothetical protein [Candidatus Nomurabacteria bacterium]